MESPVVRRKNKNRRNSSVIVDSAGCVDHGELQTTYDGYTDDPESHGQVQTMTKSKPRRKEEIDETANRETTLSNDVSSPRSIDSLRQQLGWVLVLLGVVMILLLHHQQQLDEPMASLKTTNNREGREICPNTPFDSQSLYTAIVANDQFHKLGGNLKSVQRFRDQTIDDTLRKLDLEFKPKDEQPRTQNLASYLQNYYHQHYDPRGGYGKPLPGRFVRRGDTKNKRNFPELFSDRWIEPIEETEGRAKWDASLGPIGPVCKSLVQLGNRKRDGYKFYCPVHKNDSSSESDKNYNMSADRNLVAEKAARKGDDTCHIISVGGNDNWKFEVAAADTLGCVIHTFDCTLPGNTPKHKPNRPDIRFYPHCLDGRTHQDNHGRSYVTYTDLLQIAGIDQPPTYLKMDVEGFEYDVFSQMIQQDAADSSTSLLPRQIQVELHWATRMTGVEWMPRTRSAGELALLSSMMYLGGGYMPIHLDFEPYCSTCMEILYYRVLC